MWPQVVQDPLEMKIDIVGKISVWPQITQDPLEMKI